MTPWVPIQDAADVLMRSIKTLRTWAHRNVIRSRRDEQGCLLVHWGDAKRAADTRTQRHVA